MAIKSKPDQRQAAKPTCILVLQGGGAMGAYHVGAFQALQEKRLEPDWVCGISIGAINGAIIAGNAPEHRLQKLEAFWDRISRPSPLSPFGAAPVRTWEHDLSYGTTLLLGQPGFFVPRPVNPYFAPPGMSATSFYDTAPLFDTIGCLVDFDRLNQNLTRLSVGATDIETGELRFFDTKTRKNPIGAEHVVGSGSLPPGFPPTLVEGRYYWDGGCVSNTPLDAVFADQPSGHVVAFVIDLWSASGPVPTTMNMVEWRAKQIQYSSSISHRIEAVAAKVNLRHARKLLAGSGKQQPDNRLDLVHIVYHPTKDQIPASDAEFSRGSIVERQAAGLSDMRLALEAQPWNSVVKPAHAACMVHRVTGGTVATDGTKWDVVL